MKLFRHRHREQEWADLMVSSIATGAPVKVADASACRCGKILRVQITPAGYQQIGWGAHGEDFRREVTDKLRGQVAV